MGLLRVETLSDIGVLSKHFRGFKLSLAVFD